MAKGEVTLPSEAIEPRIRLVQGHKVLLDYAVPERFHVSTNME
jgi:hypothetical protein